jgi:adenylate cyclase
VNKAEAARAANRVGDPVNVAARLQDLTKPYGCEVLMSEEVYEQAGFGPDDLPQHDVEARGRLTGVRARSALRASDLGALMATR